MGSVNFVEAHLLAIAALWLALWLLHIGANLVTMLREKRGGQRG